jgi:hypothetical protein
MTDKHGSEANQQNVSASTMSEDIIEPRIINVNNSNKLKHSICCRYCCIRTNQQMYKSNFVSTGKYNLLTFLPQNLKIQFSKMANLYFLIMCLLELYRPISDSGGQPVVALPLSFVVGLSMLKDAFEDIKRHISDRTENMKKVMAGVRKVKKGIVE